MASQQAQSNLYYRVTEDTLDRFQMVRDSLKLLMSCAEDSGRSTIELPLLANHLRLLVEQMNNAISEADWNGKKV